MLLVLIFPLVATYLTFFKRALEEKSFQKHQPATKLQRSEWEWSQQLKPSLTLSLLERETFFSLCGVPTVTNPGIAITTMSVATAGVKTKPPLVHTLHPWPTQQMTRQCI